MKALEMVTGSIKSDTLLHNASERLCICCPRLCSPSCSSLMNLAKEQCL